MFLPDNNIKKMLLAISLLIAGMASAYAQRSTSVAPPASQPKSVPSQATAPIAAPQVNTVVHRLNGLKILNLLRRNGIKVAPLSNEMLLTDAVQTNITAGLSLGDGNFVARLPRAELESSVMSPGTRLLPAVAASSIEPPPALFVLERDGREVSLKFMGLDGGTGLSLLSADSSRLTTVSRDAREDTLELGQRVRVISPVSVPNTEGLTSNEVFVNIAVLEGNLIKISRGSSGNLIRITLVVPELSPASVGGIAVNDAGETIGLVDASNGTEAQVIPIAGVRRAVERIRMSFESKPRPWLGARGVSVSTVTLDQLYFTGWKRSQAATLIANQIGVVLTAVPLQTPAWRASLRVGDVVTRVNGSQVRSAEEFSSRLAQAVGKAPVRFTIMRPDRTMPRVVSVTLNLSINPVLEMEVAEQRAARLTSSDPLVARGLETLPVTADFATRLKARGGLFVIFVHSESAASRAGMLAGDIIESVNNELVSDSNLPVSLPNRITLDVVRNGQKLAIQIETDISSPSGSIP